MAPQVAIEVAGARVGIALLDGSGQIVELDALARGALGASASAGLPLGALVRADGLSEILSPGERPESVVVASLVSNPGELVSLAASRLGARVVVRIERVEPAEEKRSVTAELAKLARSAHRMETDRMIAAGTLAAGVAHEINNPLAYVLANIDFTLEELALPTAGEKETLAEIRAALEDARKGARRVRDIVRDLRTFSRQDHDTLERIDVGAVLESAIGLSWNEMRQRAVVERDLQSTPPVLANESKLGQVFLNLLLNASQAMPAGRASDNRIVIRSRTDADFAVVEVEDTGSGIDPLNLPRIFDPFFTTKPIGEGTGLGLSMCQGIVRGLGGSIEVVRSVLGQGSHFRVRLPGAPEAASIPAEPRRVPSEARRGRILVVDDEPLVIMAVRRALGGEHEIEEASGGREALSMLERASFDLVLCDLTMADLDGIEVHARLLARDPALAARFVLLTGGAFTARANEFLDSCVVPVVEKPFDAHALRALIRARLA